MLVIHGEDKISSYKRLSDIISSYKERQIEVISYDAQGLDLTTFRQEISPELFGVTKCFVIKNLISSVKSKSKDKIIDFLSSNPGLETILYESKSISITGLKPFSKIKTESYQISPIIFRFLDCIRPRNFRTLMLGWKKLIDGGNEPEYIFTMIVRQIRLLIQAKSGSSYLKLKPYPKAQIIAQSELFSLDQLIDLHTDLYEIDKKIKTGANPLPLEQLLPGFFQKI